MKTLALALLLVQQVGFDHLILHVKPGAPERAVLERAGFRARPGVNHHDGQGTASITFEFENAMLELLWPDKDVPVSAGLEKAHEKFEKRTEWRTTGWSPIGIALHRAGPDGPIPVPTWSVAPPWMEPGTAMVMLTPRDDTKSPSISIHPHPLTDEKGRPTTHPIGVKRVTAVRLLAPPDYTPIDALRYLEKERVLTIGSAAAWAVELTFDDGKQGKERDFRPDLPLRIRY